VQLYLVPGSENVADVLTKFGEDETSEDRYYQRISPIVAQFPVKTTVDG
jgi:hypothetical protein